jgi:hypothetical protein
MISISPLTRTNRGRVRALNEDIVDRHEEPARSDSLVDSGGDEAEYGWTDRALEI